MSEYYAPSGYPADNAQGSSASMRAELLLISAGFDKLPTLAGNGLELVRINSGGTAMEAVPVANAIQGASLTTLAFTTGITFSSGATLNFNSGNVVLTHSAGILTMGTGDLRVTTAGTNTASVVTVGGTQTLTGKTLTAPTITSLLSTGIDDNANALAITINSSEQVLIGHTASITADAGGGSTITTGTLQTHGLTGQQAAVMAARWSITNAEQPYFVLAKGGGGSVGTFTAVADDESLGEIVWNGSDGSAFTPAASIRAEVDGSVSASDVPGRLIFSTASGSSVTDAMQINTTQDVGIGVAAGTAPSARLHVKDSVSGDVVVIESTEAGATAAVLTLYRNSASPADNDGIFNLNFDGKDGGGNVVGYARIQVDAFDVTDGTEDGLLSIGTVQAGTLNADAWRLQEGWYADNATGGDMGVGTINADSVHDDGGAALTCYPLAAYLDDGALDIGYWHNTAPDWDLPASTDLSKKKVERILLEGADPIAIGAITPSRKKERRHPYVEKFAARLGTEYDPLTIEGLRKHIHDKRHLPWMPNPANFDAVRDKKSVGHTTVALTEGQDILAVLVLKLAARVEILEAAVNP